MIILDKLRGDGGHMFENFACVAEGQALTYTCFNIGGTQGGGDIL
jgi:hypothetical protein